MSLERRRHVCAGLMDRFDQGRDPRRHHEQILRLDGAGIAIGVRRPFARKDRGALRSLDLSISKPEPERSPKDVPRFVVCVMHVKRRDPVVAYLGRPLNDDEVVAGPAERTACQRLHEHVGNLTQSIRHSVLVGRAQTVVPWSAL